MPRSKRKSAQPLLWWLSVLLCSGFALPCAAKPANKSQVVLLIPPDLGPQTSPQFADNLKWQLDELGLELESTRTEQPFELDRYVALAEALLTEKQATMALWVVRDRERVVMYLYDLKKQAVRERPLSTNDSPVVAAEELAIIARSAILAHLEGMVSDAPEPLPEAAPAEPQPSRPTTARHEAPPREHPSPAANEPSVWQFALRGGFETTAPLEAEGLEPAVKIATTVGYRRLYAELGYAFYAGSTLRSNWATIELHRHPAELNLGYAFYQRQSWVAAELFSTLDSWRRKTTSVTEPLAQTAQTRHWVSAIGLRLRGTAPLTSTLAATFAAGGYCVLNPQRFEAARADDRETLGQMARFAPALDVDLIWYLN
jgi:hypothetical protein